MLEDKEKKRKNSYTNSTKSSNYFVNIITNEKGEKHFLYVMEFFKKIEISEFQEIYKIDPVRELMKLRNVVGDDNLGVNEKNASGKKNLFFFNFINF